MSEKKFLAFDFGAESGRAIIGTLKDGKITLKEIHRFPTGMIKIHGTYRWNIFRLYEEILTGMKKCVSDEKVQPDAIGIDTWGVDYALFGEDGAMLSIPYGYRDSRTQNAIEEFSQKIPKDRIYALTGIQFMWFNTLFQLHAAQRDKLPIMDKAKNLLFIPDIFNYFLTGEKKTDFSFATTSQLFNPQKDTWEPELFDALGIDINIMPEIIEPGSAIGPLTKEVQEITKMQETPVVAVASHDTGSAIAAIPAEGKNWAYISSGTWSLMGIESDRPLISEKTLALNLTNEGGVNKTYRVLKNIMGLWLLQQCKKAWVNKNYSYAQLVEMAHKAPAFKSIVDPDNDLFINPQDMPSAINEYCKKTGQETPANDAEYVRLIMESLALKYRAVLDQLKEVSPTPIEKIYIIGGGVQNETLCQFTANATGMPVITGSAEGTALGNIMVQAMAMGDEESLDGIREVIRNSFESKTFEPQNTKQWEEIYRRFLKLVD